MGVRNEFETFIEEIKKEVKERVGQEDGQNLKWNTKVLLIMYHYHFVVVSEIWSGPEPKRLQEK